ncbi:MAG: ChaN family lipoprotein [Paracoccaceae bacterium]|nr:ChaN family lipoprotein [Paracoccaceae bacterium]
MRFLTALLLLIAPAASAVGGDFDAQVVFLGEQHDNPAHHARQAEIVADLQPKAVVWEMLTPAQAAEVVPALIGDAPALEATLGWEESGWPDFDMYHPIFAAAPDAAHYGAALPRQEARRLMGEEIADVFGDGADAFGLRDPLPEEQQETREALQLAAHCDAMPAEMLPIMVNIQRLRDALIARAAKQALQETGGPVAVITGNGHARLDWGAPAALRLAAPDVTVFAFGQGEVGFGEPDGGFDRVEIAATVDRGDPCEAFR